MKSDKCPQVMPQNCWLSCCIVGNVGTMFRHVWDKKRRHLWFCCIVFYPLLKNCPPWVWQCYRSETPTHWLLIRKVIFAMPQSDLKSASFALNKLHHMYGIYHCSMSSVNAGNANTHRIHERMCFIRTYGWFKSSTHSLREERCGWDYSALKALHTHSNIHKHSQTHTHTHIHPQPTQTYF